MTGRYNLGTTVYTKSDFSGENLEGKYFGNAEFPRYSDFERSKLKGSNFEDARLESANFKYADLRNVDFTDAYMPFADFTGADLRGAIFTKTYVKKAIFTDAKMDSADKLKNSIHGKSRTYRNLIGLDTVEWSLSPEEERILKEEERILKEEEERAREEEERAREEERRIREEEERAREEEKKARLLKRQISKLCKLLEWKEGMGEKEFSEALSKFKEIEGGEGTESIKPFIIDFGIRILAEMIRIEDSNEVFFGLARDIDMSSLRILNDMKKLGVGSRHKQLKEIEGHIFWRLNILEKGRVIRRESSNIIEDLRSWTDYSDIYEWEEEFGDTDEKNKFVETKIREIAESLMDEDISDTQLKVLGKRVRGLQKVDGRRGPHREYLERLEDVINDRFSLKVHVLKYSMSIFKMIKFSASKLRDLFRWIRENSRDY